MLDLGPPNNVKSIDLRPRRVSAERCSEVMSLPLTRRASTTSLENVIMSNAATRSDVDNIPIHGKNCQSEDRGPRPKLIVETFDTLGILCMNNKPNISTSEVVDHMCRAKDIYKNGCGEENRISPPGKSALLGEQKDPEARKKHDGIEACKAKISRATGCASGFPSSPKKMPSN